MCVEANSVAVKISFYPFTKANAYDKCRHACDMSQVHSIVVGEKCVCLINHLLVIYDPEVVRQYIVHGNLKHDHSWYKKRYHILDLIRNH